MNRGLPRSVFLDGEKMAGSVFKARLKDDLSMPIRRPRLLGAEDQPPE
jgi:hypothetical protein